ncbi:histidine kinase N-terminal 7TM domain-containing protein [Thermoflexus sp.]|uniref:histidine kinase N-terminal 7TM domain-containing protein n=1 Tax=Thermoflexus sp. TaxID=1969742 RepID=UPI002ADE59F8|nr:histidine kinase N-terminal 7TM domain-containing protein [Thermoflexus sp.]
MLNPLILMLFGAASIALGVAVYAWRARPAPGSTALFLLNMLIALWTSGYALELLQIDLPNKIFWAKVQYLGIAFVPTLWLIVALQYTGRARWTSPIRLGVLSLEPLLTIGLAWTNEHHGLIWATVALDTHGGFPRMEVIHGAWFYIHVAYAYGALLLSTVLFLRFLRHRPPLYQGQAGALLVSVIAPWIANGLTALVNPFPRVVFDLTPYGFVVGGIALVWGTYRFRLLDVTPIAHEMIVESMSDGLIVLDAVNRIVDLNPAAARMLNLDRSQVLGRPAREILAPWSDLVARFRDVLEAREEIALGEGKARRFYELQISPVQDRSGRVIGRAIVIRDITQRRQMELALEERERFLRSLYEILGAALKTPDLRSMLQVLADQLGGILGADGCYITLWDERTGLPIPMAAYGPMREIYPTLHAEPGEITATESVLRAGHPLPIEDVFNTPFLSPKIAAQFPTRSMLALPMIAEGKWLGGLLIAYDSPHQFAEEEIARGEIMARIVALAIAKARSLEEARSRWQEADTLQQAIAAVVEAPTLTEMLQRILEQLRRLIPYDSASVQWLREGYLEIVGQSNLPESTMRLRLPIPGDNPNTRVILERRALILDDAPAAYSSFREPPHDRIRSWMGIPLIVQDRVIGMLALDSHQPGFFREDHLRLIGPFVNSAAVALERARLLEEERQRREELNQLNRDLEAFAHMVAHDLKHPLSVIIGTAEFLERELGALPLEDLRDSLRMIDRAGRKMHRIIEELLLLASVRYTEVPRKPVAMEAIVAEALERLEPLIAETGARILLPESWPSALGYGPWLEEVWVNYLSNAIQHGGRPPIVELGADSLPDGRVRFWVKDNGPGIPLEEQARLFAPFGIRSRHAGGHGIGLSIVRMIVEKLGGEVGVESAPGQGSTFWFTLHAVSEDG